MKKNVELEQKNVGLSFCFFNVKTMTTYPSSRTAEKWNAIFYSFLFHRIPSTHVLSSLTLSMPAIKFWFQELLPIFTPNLFKYGRSRPYSLTNVLQNCFLYIKKYFMVLFKVRFIKKKKKKVLLVQESPLFHLRSKTAFL